MEPLRSFQFLCLVLILGIRLEQGQEAYNPDVHYCNSDCYSSGEFCSDVYEPVCTKYQVYCVTDPCPPQEKEFPNCCTACQDSNVISYTIGKCDKCPKENSCKDDYPYLPCPCPAIYDPVCVTSNIGCLYGPCPPIRQEYPNACMACNDPTVSSYTPGPCEGDDGNYEGEYEYENEGEIYVSEESEYENENEENEAKKCNVIPGIQVLCIYDYIPVCGYWNDCAAHSPCHQTFKNNCVACYYAGADYYYDGECPPES